MSLPVGLGLGWRPETAQLIERRTGEGTLQFTEVVAENHSPGRLSAPLSRLVDRGVPVLVHGVSLSLGGAEPLSTRRLDHLARLAEALRAPLVSEHICLVRAGELDSGHLLPVARRHDVLDLLIDSVRQAQRSLPVPLVLENIATLFSWPDDELDEASFITTLLEETGAGLLLDISNLYANARNHGIDPLAFIDALPLDRIAYVHVAGGVERGDLYHDTHAHPVAAGPLGLLAELVKRCPARPVMLERDEGFLGLASLEAELDTIDAALRPEHENEGRRHAS